MKIHHICTRSDLILLTLGVGLEGSYESLFVHIKQVSKRIGDVQYPLSVPSAINIMPNSQTIKSVSIDMGNRLVVSSVDGDGIVVRRSVMAKTGSAKTPHSPSNEIDYVSIGDETYILGDHLYPNARTTASLDMGDNMSKVRALLPFILSTTARKGDGPDVATVENIYMMHPNPTPAILKAIRETLAGEHIAIVNNRQTVRTINPDGIRVYPEPEPSLYYLHNLGLLNCIPERGVVGIIDVGGKTLCIMFASMQNGIPKPIPQGRVYLESSGVYALANRFCRAIISEGLSAFADPDVVMDALHSGWMRGDRCLYYGEPGAARTFQFTELRQSVLLAWLSDDVFPPYNSLARGFDRNWFATYVLGGGSNYFPSSMFGQDKHWYRPDHPEFTNILGLNVLAAQEQGRLFGGRLKAVG